METAIRTFLLIFGLCGAAAAYAATDAPIMDVVVTKDPHAIVAYRGKTTATGNFATTDLQPGAYVILFTSKAAAALKGSQLSIDIGGGKSPMKAPAVPAEKFGAGGVAVKVEVGRSSKLVGQIASAKATLPSRPGIPETRSNVKVMKGKKYVWVPGGIETRMGGRWVEAGTGASRLPGFDGKIRDSDALRGAQEMRGAVSEPRSHGGANLEIMDQAGSLHRTPLFARAPDGAK